MRWQNNVARVTALAAAVATVAVVWLIVLPAVGRWPTVRARIDRNEARGINPEAMFYTELNAMPAAEARVRRQIGDAF